MTQLCNAEFCIGFSLDSTESVYRCVRKKGHKPTWQHTAYAWMANHLDNPQPETDQGDMYDTYLAPANE